MQQQDIMDNYHYSHANHNAAKFATITPHSFSMNADLLRNETRAMFESAGKACMKMRGLIEEGRVVSSCQS